jgi:predicted PurR-regulated permease PerM
MSDEAVTSDAGPTAPVQQRTAPLADLRTSTWALLGLLLVAVLTVLHLARDAVVPVAVALVLCLVLRPVVRAMKRLHIPEALSAALVVLGLIAGFLGAVYSLAEPAGVWLEKAPQGLREIGVKLRHVTGQMKDVSDATAQVEGMTQDMAGGSTSATRSREVTVKPQTLASGILDAAGSFSLSAISTLVLLYFLLACGNLFLLRTLAVTPRLADKKRTLDIAQQVESAVSEYLLTVSLINLILGCAVALAMVLLGVPNPALWGAMVAVFNFIPYLGEIASVTALTLVGLLTFDDLWRGLLVPGVFCVLSAAERYILTPLILGRRLSLNPVVIVLSVLFWGAMWGIAGALLAVPILVALKTLCDRVESLQGFGKFLSA